MPDRRRLVLVAAACSAALLLALVWSFSKSGHHRTGTNGIARLQSVALPPGHKLCQGGEFAPPRTGRIRFFPRAGGGPVGPFTVTLLTEGGARSRSGRVPVHAYKQSEAAAATIPNVDRQDVNAAVCVANDGTAPAAIMGDRWFGQGNAALLLPGPRQTPGPWYRMHFDYQFRDASTWWSFADELAERFGLVKATFFGSWTFWLTLVALLALAFGTIWWTARALAR
jgi:hypothetical protein